MPPPTTIATWLYAEPEGEESVYPQVVGQGAPSSARFQAIYWRCVAVFFASSARHALEARRVLFTNVAAVPRVDGHDLGGLLRRLGVEVVPLPYTFLPPDDYFGAWRNQFYVFDAIRWLADEVVEDGGGLLLDSDCVFVRSAGVLSEAAQEHGALTYDFGLPPQGRNGLTPEATATLWADLDRELDAPGGSAREAACGPTYHGGEIVAATGAMLRHIDALAGPLWAELMRRHATGRPKFNEEAQALTYLYERLGVARGTANPFLRRIWTTLVGYSDVQPSDLDLVVWHLPAEKRYGLRRLFADVMDESSPFWRLDGDAWRSHLAGRLGVPRRTLGKLARDVPTAVRDKLRALPGL